MPLIERELRVRARHPGTFWARSGVGLVGTFICWSTLNATSGTAVSGEGAFGALAMLGFVLSCAACLTVASGIELESLEILFLTRVKPVELLLGKFGAAGISCLCALAAFTPIVVLPLLAGGVSGGEAARTALVLFDTMCLSLALGLLAPSGQTHFRTALGALALLLVILLVPMLAGWADPGTWVMLFSPIGALQAASDAAYGKRGVDFWISLGLIFGIACLLLAGAVARLRITMRTTEAPERRFEPRRRKRAGLSRDPIRWLVAAQPGITGAVWLIVGVWLAYWLLWYGAAALGTGFAASRWTYSWGVTTALSLILQVVFAWAATRFLLEARRTGELELLMTTPLGAGTLIEQEKRALRRLFFWPTIALILPSVISTAWGYLHPQFASGFELFHSINTTLSSTNTVLGMLALVWLGIWQGFGTRSPGAAILRILALTMGASYLIGWLARLVLPRYVAVPSNLDWKRLTLSWWTPLLLTMAYNVWLIRWARKQAMGAVPAGAEPAQRTKFPRLMRLLYKADVSQ